MRPCAMRDAAIDHSRARPRHIAGGERMVEGVVDVALALVPRSGAAVQIGLRCGSRRRCSARSISREQRVVAVLGVRVVERHERDAAR